MYQIGELVQYGTSGVCRIEDIVQDVPGLPKDAECYLLIPVSKKEEKIYTPVDNDKVKMRRILSKEEAMELFEKVVSLSRTCQKLLADAQLKVTKLISETGEEVEFDTENM